DLATDPRFENHASRWQHVHILNDAVAVWMAERNACDVAAVLDEHGVPYSILYTIEDILQDPHYRARENIIEVDHPQLGSVKMQGIVPKLSETAPGPPRAAPALGADNDAV